MIVYGALLSPYVRKVCVALREKGLDYDLRITSPHTADTDFASASPFGKIPAIRDGDFTLADSSAIFAYIEAKCPSPALLPSDPQVRGRAVWLEEYSDTMLGSSGLKVLFNRLVGPKILKIGGDEALAAQGEAEMPALWRYLEGIAPAEGWLTGEFSLADIAIACMIRSLTHVAVHPSPEDYPATTAWYARVQARPAWREVEESDPLRR